MNESGNEKQNKTKKTGIYLETSTVYCFCMEGKKIEQT